MARPMGPLCPAVFRTSGPSASLAAISCSSGITAGDSPASGVSCRGEKGRADLRKQRTVQQQHIQIPAWSQDTQAPLHYCCFRLNSPLCFTEKSIADVIAQYQQYCVECRAAALQQRPQVTCCAPVVHGQGHQQSGHILVCHVHILGLPPARPPLHHDPQVARHIISGPVVTGRPLVACCDIPSNSAAIMRDRTATGFCEGYCSALRGVSARDTGQLMRNSTEG